MARKGGEGKHEMRRQPRSHGLDGAHGQTQFRPLSHLGRTHVSRVTTRQLDNVVVCFDDVVLVVRAALLGGQELGESRLAHVRHGHVLGLQLEVVVEGVRRRCSQVPASRSLSAACVKVTVLRAAACAHRGHCRRLSQEMSTHPSHRKQSQNETVAKSRRRPKRTHTRPRRRFVLAPTWP